MAASDLQTVAVDHKTKALAIPYLSSRLEGLILDIRKCPIRNGLQPYQTVIRIG